MKWYGKYGGKVSWKVKNWKKYVDKVGKPVAHARIYPFGSVPVALSVMQNDTFCTTTIVQNVGKMTSKKKHAGVNDVTEEKTRGKSRHRKKKTRGKITSFQVRVASGSTTSHHLHKCGFVTFYILLILLSNRFSFFLPHVFGVFTPCLFNLIIYWFWVGDYLGGNINILCITNLLRSWLCWFMQTLWLCWFLYTIWLCWCICTICLYWFMYNILLCWFMYTA